MREIKDISVVIGFKDWGLRRLRMAVSSLVNSFGSLNGEVIVSDYGSANSAGVREALEALGAKYVYTTTNGVWSRTRALNAGFAESTGRVLVATDADMVFSPQAMEVVGRRILSDPSTALLLQCRDLPPEWTDAEIEAKGMHWPTFERVGRRRPRWGMGGMMAVSRPTFLKVRGYDERMQTYGGEDIDFAQRVRRAGTRLVWIEDPRVRMFHMWHPSTAGKHALSPSETADVDSNKRIMREDKTFVRNVHSWVHRPIDAPPLVSLVISTHNRAHLILDTIHSVQAQTIQDFEIVIVDDGSTDDTRAVIEGIGDPRIRYVWQQNQGVAAARNRGLDECRGQYVGVLDDDDIALPWRLEAQFDAMTDGVNATFGSFANFDDESGALQLHRTKVFTDEVSADKGGAPGHSTWMVDRELMAALRYDESLPSGVDNNFALRALRSGLVWRHSGRVHTLRRLHADQITARHGDSQISAARGAYHFFTFVASPWTLGKLRRERDGNDYVAIVDAEVDKLVPFLPDHLVKRRLLSESFNGSSADDWTLTMADGQRKRVAIKSDALWSDLAELGGRGSLGVVATLRNGIDSNGREEHGPVTVHRIIDLVRGSGEIKAVGDGEVCAELLMVGAIPRHDTDDWVENNGVHLRCADQEWTWVSRSVKTSELDAARVHRLASRGTLTITGSDSDIQAFAGELLAAEEGIDAR